MTDFAYRIFRHGEDTILAVDTRSVSKGRGFVLAAFSGLIGLFFLVEALTSEHDSTLGLTIFVASAILAGATLYAIRRIVVRNIIFTADALLVDGDAGRRSFELAQIEGVLPSRHSLKMKYGPEAVTLLRRVPDADRVGARVNRVLQEYKQRTKRR